MAMVLKEEKYTISKSGNSTIRDFLATTLAVIWKLFLWLVVYSLTEVFIPTRYSTYCMQKGEFVSLSATGWGHPKIT